MSEFGTVSDLAIRIERAWRPYQDLIASLSPEQLQGATDENGWTIRDHIAHVTAWEGGVTAVLQGRSRAEGMGVEDEDLQLEDINAFNARLREATASIPAEDVVEEAQLRHEGFMMELEALPEEAVRWPRSKFVPDAKDSTSAGDWFWDNSGGHYEQHMRYIEAILGED